MREDGEEQKEKRSVNIKNNPSISVNARALSETAALFSLSAETRVCV